MVYLCRLFSNRNIAITHTHTNYFDSVVKEPGPFRPVEPANSTAFQNAVKKMFQKIIRLSIKHRFQLPSKRPEDLMGWNVHSKTCQPDYLFRLGLSSRFTLVIEDYIIPIFRIQFHNFLWIDMPKGFINCAIGVSVLA